MRILEVRSWVGLLGLDNTMYIKIIKLSTQSTPVVV